MPTERIQRRIDALLDEAEAAMSAGDWSAVAEKARAVLAMDPDNEDAPALLRAAAFYARGNKAAREAEAAAQAATWTQID